ncbi:MAG: hypothetical protein PHS57_04695 [Alphaproteobacteria bacterium]|nr:hypothetical protein [Alphaproteobacteria bacterium]
MHGITSFFLYNRWTLCRRCTRATTTDIGRFCQGVLMDQNAGKNSAFFYPVGQPPCDIALKKFKAEHNGRCPYFKRADADSPRPR